MRNFLIKTYIFLFSWFSLPLILLYCDYLRGHDSFPNYNTFEAIIISYLIWIAVNVTLLSVPWVIYILNWIDIYDELKKNKLER